ncbi:hypothetical protein VM98_23060 [Streptomyces rubellomurinus subsp. indigoferus]|nr:hypothetical protein VM98_23060 [Streptomyces rubellomurinus subsp. indigoferus]
MGRFFTITARSFDAGRTAPQMFSGAIDAAWHQLLTDPAAHDAFTTEHAGRPLTHSPIKGAGFITWLSTYEEAYGPLPQIWFTDATGTVDTDSLARYRETGQVWAEWDCSPAPGDDDAVPGTTSA